MAVNIAYIVAAALFIFGLKMLGFAGHGAARQRCFLPSGMLDRHRRDALASKGIVELSVDPRRCAVVGGVIVRALAARLVAMTSMPEMVALFNGSGGTASLLVGASALLAADRSTKRRAIGDVHRGDRLPLHPHRRRHGFSGSSLVAWAQTGREDGRKPRHRVSRGSAW